MTPRGAVSKLDTPQRLRSMLRKMLDLPTLRDLAHEAGVSYFAIRQYRQGKRTPSPAVLARLSRALRQLGVRVEGDAGHLARVAASAGLRLEHERRARLKQRRSGRDGRFRPRSLREWRDGP